MTNLKHKSLFIILLGLLICLPALIPLFHQQFFHLHDFTHVARLSEMHEALMDGHFPVRWSRNLGYGFGMPQFNFYAPLAYYIAEVFHLVGFNALNSIKLLVGFNFLVSFWAMYFLVKRPWGTLAGILAATAFIYIPYRAVDTYVRGAFGELTAITMLALCFLTLVYLFYRPDWRWVGFSALAVAALVLSHNLVALISLPFLLVLAAILILISDSNDKRALLIKFCVVFCLGIGLSSFYALPALTEKQYTMVDTLTQGFSNYHHHFLYFRQFFIGDWGYGGSIAGLDDDISFQIGWLQVLLAFLAGAALVFRFRKLKVIDKTLVSYSLIGILVAMFLSTYKSQLIWEHFEAILAFIQFPWRFLSVIIVLVSIASGASLLIFYPRIKVARVPFVIAVAALLVIINVGFFRPQGYLEHTEDLYYTDPVKIQSHMSGIIPDFIPRHELIGDLKPPDSRFEVGDSATELTVKVDRVHEFALSVKAQTSDILTIHIFDFPGWQLYLNGKKIDHMTDSVTGLMSVYLPPSTEDVIISGVFEEQGLRLMVDIISLTSLFIILYLLMPTSLMRKDGNGVS